MSWQVCPLCKGTGICPLPGTYSSMPPCPTCKGQRIINEITGRPPLSTQESTQDVSNISSPGSQLQEPRPE